MSKKKKIIGAGAGAGMLVEEEVVQLEAVKSNLAYTNHTNRSDHNGRTDHDDRTVTPYQRADPVHRGYIDRLTVMSLSLSLSGVGAVVLAVVDSRH